MEDRLGIVPPEIRAMYEREEFVDSAAHKGRELDKALKAYNWRLSCVFVREGVPEDQLPGGAIAGRWHVRRFNDPPMVPTFIAICAPGGGYRDPDIAVDQLVAELSRRDLTRKGVLEGMMERSRTDSKKALHARELEREQRVDELALGLRAGKRVRGEGGLTKSFDRKRSKAQKESEERKAAA